MHWEPLVTGSSPVAPPKLMNYMRGVAQLVEQRTSKKLTCFFF